MGHDHRPDGSRRQPPRSLKWMLALVVAVAVRDVVGAREVLTEVMRRARLQRPAVGHHRLDAHGVLRAGELLRFRLAPLDHRNRQPVLGELAVAVEHGVDLLGCLAVELMKGVALLPEELGGAQEESRAMFPAHHVAPLVDLHREIAPRVDPVGVHGADDRLAGRPHREALLEVLAAATGDPRDLRIEALDVVRLLLQVRLRDEQREVHVLVTGALDHVVERALDVLPQRKAVRTDDHAAAYGRVVGKLGTTDDVRVPAVEILALRRDPLFVGHGGAVYVRTPSRSLKPTGRGFPSAINRASSSAISCNSSSSALTSSPSGSVETTLPLR